MVLIRADANREIGAGHLMRCLSVAKALEAFGETVRFVTADHAPDALIRQNGFRSICMECSWDDLASERETLQCIIEQYKPRLLIIDSYQVTAAYFQALSGVVKTAYLDDLNCACWDVDYLINYNIFASSYDYTQYRDTRTKLLRMPYYAPLREEFRDLPKHETKRQVTDLLVLAGGSDPVQVTEKMICEICPLWETIQFHFVVGALNPRIMQIKGKAKERTNVVLHINERNMSALMQKCDLAVSAAGFTLYELCACGTPAVVYSLAENQRIAAREFEACGLMVDVGDCRANENFWLALRQALESLIKDAKQRARLSERMQRVVDGMGAVRIAQELVSTATVKSQ